jgi:mono/diheme cytochrome c family protein
VTPSRLAPTLVALVAAALCVAVAATASPPGSMGGAGAVEIPNLGKNRPGDAAAGYKLFQGFCAHCHTFRATGERRTVNGVSGRNLDKFKPTYSKVVTTIVQGGGGGVVAEGFLDHLSFKEIYDIATFVSKYSGSPRSYTAEQIKKREQQLRAAAAAKTSP